MNNLQSSKLYLYNATLEFLMVQWSDVVVTVIYITHSYDSFRNFLSNSVKVSPCFVNLVLLTHRSHGNITWLFIGVRGSGRESIIHYNSVAVGPDIMIKRKGLPHLSCV